MTTDDDPFADLGPRDDTPTRTARGRAVSDGTAGQGAGASQAAGNTGKAPDADADTAAMNGSATSVTGGTGGSVSRTHWWVLPAVGAIVAAIVGAGVYYANGQTWGPGSGVDLGGGASLSEGTDSATDATAVAEMDDEAVGVLREQLGVAADVAVQAQLEQTLDGIAAEVAGNLDEQRGIAAAREAARAAERAANGGVAAGDNVNSAGASVADTDNPDPFALGLPTLADPTTPFHANAAPDGTAATMISKAVEDVTPDSGWLTASLVPVGESTCVTIVVTELGITSQQQRSVRLAGAAVVTPIREVRGVDGAVMRFLVTAGEAGSVHVADGAGAFPASACGGQRLVTPQTADWFAHDFIVANPDMAGIQCNPEWVDRPCTVVVRNES